MSTKQSAPSKVEAVWYAARTLSVYPGRSWMKVSSGRYSWRASVRLFWICLWAGLALGAVKLNAEDSSSARSSSGIEVDTKGVDPKAIEKAPSFRVLQDVSLNYSYAPQAKLKSGAEGKLDEQAIDFNYGVSIPISADLSILTGLQYSRLDFGQPEHSPLPDSLEKVSVSLGAHYKISDQWSVFGILSPELRLLNGWDAIGSEEFQLGGALGASYEFNPALSLRFGFALNSGWADSPVIPLLGLNWRFAEAWTLNLGFPKTAVEYQVLPQLRLSVVELAFQGGTYHTGNSYGNSVGRSDLNDRDLQYTEVRVGSGATYALTKNVDLSLAAGVIAYREFDFKDTGYKQKVDPAPYIQAGVKVGF